MAELNRGNPAAGNLGRIISAIYNAGQPRFELDTKSPGDIPLSRLYALMPELGDLSEQHLRGALSILGTLGLILVDGENLRAMSRNAHFALGSLAKFLEASAQLVDEPIGKGEEQYLVNLTLALETVRTQLRRDVVDQSPLHQKRIVNVVIKGRQIRKARAQDVYLLVFHDDWKEYHLVGVSDKGRPGSDEDIARSAMAEQLRLSPDQYILDVENIPKDVETVAVSKTTGALTRYTFAIRLIKEIRIDLKLKDWNESSSFAKNSNYFRWFTWDEIKQRRSENGEPIMDSTPLVLLRFDPKSIPMSARRAQDARKRVGIRNELSQRFTLTQAYALIAVVVLASFVAVLRLYLPSIIPLLAASSIPLFENLASIFTVITTVLTAILIIIGIYSLADSLRK